MELTEKEEKFIKRYQKSSKTHILSIIFILAFFTIQTYLMFSRVIPGCTKPFHEFPKLEDFIKVILLECLGASAVWFVLLLVTILGEFRNYKIIKRIFNKI